MQNVSQEYKNLIRNEAKRNRGYIKVYIGIINTGAQSAINVNDSRNKFAFFSNSTKPFNGFPVENLYATCEKNFTKVDGSMRFMPDLQKDVIYNNGIVTEEIAGTVYISFGLEESFDIKGLTIDFGENYPVNFSIESDAQTRFYVDNNKQNFITEDVFEGTSYFIIKPTKMRYQMNRLRIHQFTCGITNIFTNEKVFNYSFKDYVSSISETIPSQDMNLTVDNQDLYYSVDNDESALAFMEVGQEVRVSFGYDLSGKGDIEWVKENTSYLKTWSANDKQATFSATDRFDYLTEIYYKGKFRENGISLYELAKDVLSDAGFENNREYFIDPYLKNILVYNPMPAVKHSEALQIIANAGRCILYQDRDKRIRLQASFVPDKKITVNNETTYSHAANILLNNSKPAYAECSKNFSKVDGSLFFMPDDNSFLKNGYVSESIADSSGFFLENPQMIIQFEAGYAPFGIMLRFRNIAPVEFKIKMYYMDVLVEEKLVKNPNLDWIYNKQLEMMNKVIITFTKSNPFTRIFVDNIFIGDVTDYVIQYKNLTSSSPEGTRQNKIKNIKVARTIYREQKDGYKTLFQEEVRVTPQNLEYTVYFTNPSYNLSVLVIDNSNITCTIEEFSNYYATVKFYGVTQETIVNYAINGYEYAIEKNYFIKKHSSNGEEKTWENPLVSTSDHAKNLEEWLASYFLGNVEYQINYRGDPSIDANDLFYLDLKGRKRTMIRGIENTLNFNGSWSGNMKARKVVL